MTSPTVDGLGLADLLTFARCAKLLPGRLHCKTIARWATKGIATPTGERVVLRTVRAGRVRLTSELWLLEFIERQTSGGACDSVPPARGAEQRPPTAQASPSRRQATAGRLAKARAAARRRQ